jgi:GTPase SAR1 family protein
LNYEDKKRELLKKSEKLDEAINSVLESDGDNLVIEESRQKEIYELQKQSKTILEKLEKDEFEIAVVGLEKAGKSTFANALIHKDILPSASKRCTFASTKLVKGETDSAVVELYSKDEFEKDVFQKLLKDVEFPEWDKQTLDQFYIKKHNIKKIIKDSKDFEDWFSKLENEKPELFKLHRGKTDEEIADILKYRNSLELTGKTVDFTKEEIEDENFREYIKGVDIGDNNEDTDTGKPRSVKNIEITSTQLKNFKEPILYDVPGFDSPTELHEQETIKRLKNADAIILVTNVGDKPNINSPQLKILKEHTDHDGVPLKDKLFVFGNKFDTANSFAIAKTNQRTLENDVSKKHTMAKTEKVYVGSALKYLVDNNLKVDDEKYHSQYEIDSDGVTNLKDDLISYQQNEIFDVREKSLENLENKIKTVFQQILNSDKLLNIDPDMDKTSERENILINSASQIKEDFKEALKIAVNQFEEFIPKKGREVKKVKNYTPFSSQSFLDRVENKFEKLNEDEFNKFARGVTPTELNSEYRKKKLYPKFLQNFSGIVFDVVNGETEKVEKFILDTVLDEVAPEKKDELKDIFSKIIKIENQDGKFDYLFERFGRKLLDTVIQYEPFSNGRKESFEENEPEFRFLDKKSKGDGEILSFIISGKKEAISNIDSIEDFKTAFWKALQKLEISAKEYALECEKVLAPKLENLESQDSLDLKEIWAKQEDYKPYKSREKVFEQINEDIENFQTVFKDVIIPVLELERVFYDRVSKELLNLREKSNIPYLNKIIEVVEADNLAEVDKRVNENKARLEIKTEIENFLNAN